MAAQARTCIGCGEEALEASSSTLVRVVRGPHGVIAVDAKGGAAGRGAHLHPRAACIEKAAKSGLARSFKATITGVASAEGDSPMSGASLTAAIVSALDERIEGLIASAVRTRELAIGSDAASEALDLGEAKLALVATDATASAELSAVRAAIAAGRAAAWGNKLRLGELVAMDKPEGVGVVGVTSDRLARAILEAVQAQSAATHDGAASGPKPRRSFGAATHDGAASGPKPRRSFGAASLHRHGEDDGALRVAGSTNHSERGA